MEQENEYYSDRAIALFMGNTPIINDEGKYEYMVAPNCPVTSPYEETIWSFMDSSFTYSIDWNSLISVVNKIKDYSNDLSFIESLDEAEKNKNIKLYHDVEASFCSRTLEMFDVYNSVVAYIVWANKLTILKDIREKFNNNNKII